jgi:hypothetical protein
MQPAAENRSAFTVDTTGMPTEEAIAWGQFFQLMCAQMVRNTHKGWRKGYFNQSLDQQMQILKMDVAEARIALAYGIDVADKLADVANLCAIILDNYKNNPHVGGFSGD